MARSFLTYQVVFAVALMFGSIGCHADTQIKWTPNEGGSNGDGGASAGPLPLSMKQRQQLLQLEQAIAQAPDPQATLEKVAQSNQMSPQDLLSMLQRNRSDLQQQQQPGGGGGIGAGGGAAGSSLDLRNNALVKVGASAAWGVNRIARRHPRLFAAAVAALLVSAHVAHHAPKDGVVLLGPSPQRFRWGGAGGGGPTTLWMPPAGYCRSEFLESDAIPWTRRSGKQSSEARSSTLSLEDLSALFDVLLPIDRDEDDDERDSDRTPSQVHQISYQWLDRKALKQYRELDLRQAALGQAVLALDDLVPAADPSHHHRDIAPSLALDAARDLLQDQLLTEFCQIRYHSRRDRGVLAVPGMGRWGFVGLLPFVKAEGPALPRSEGDGGDPEDDTAVHLVLAAVPGYHWEGDIHVVVTLGDADSIVVQAALVVPARGRAVSRAVAKRIVSSIVESLQTSIKTRTRQSLSRSRQSATFQRRAKDKADQRRQTRQKKEREMEEMAADRRRRWQRQNPNSGHYRPSGDRMRSPNNAVYR
jgi:hypothetical protein